MLPQITLNCQGVLGERAGIRVGDQLVRIQDFPLNCSGRAPRLWRIPLLERTRYTLRRDGIEFQKDNIYIQAAPRDNALYYQYVVGFFYLAIGLFVYYRRTSASKSRQFFLLCLASFGACCFHYSGYLNTFDEVMYWGNVALHLLAPAISSISAYLPRQDRSFWSARRRSPCCIFLPRFYSRFGGERYRFGQILRFFARSALAVRPPEFGV